MKKSFLILFCILFLANLGAYAQKYLVASSDFTINDKNYRKNDIIGETDAALYIKVCEDIPANTTLKFEKIDKGTICAIVTDDTDLKKVVFTHGGKNRYDVCNTTGLSAKVEKVYKMGELGFPIEKVKVVECGDVLGLMKKFEDAIRKNEIAEGQYTFISPATCEMHLPDGEIVKLTKGDRAEIDVVSSENAITVSRFFDGKNVFPEFEISGSNLPQIPVPWYVTYKSRIIWCIVVILLIVVVIISALYIKKNSKNDWDDDKSTDYSHQHNIKNGKKNSPVGKEKPDTMLIPPADNISTLGISEFQSKIDAINIGLSTQIASTKTAIEQTKSEVNSVKILIEKINTQLTANASGSIKTAADLQKEKEKNAELEKTIKKKEDCITNLETKYNELLKSTMIEGALPLKDYLPFLSFANKLLKSCGEAEKTLMMYVNSIDAADIEIAKGFVLDFMLSKPTLALTRWYGILANIELNSQLKDTDYCPMLQNKNDSERIDFISKHFFEDVVRPYVSAILVFLEKSRLAKNFGIKTSSESFNISGLINSILTITKEEKIDVDYRKLFEKITSSGYDKLDIVTDVPEKMSEVLDKYPSDTIVYVYNYAINSAISSTSEKTKCIMKL